MATLLTLVALVGSLFTATHYASIQDLYYASGTQTGARHLRLKAVPVTGDVYIFKDAGMCDIGYGIDQYSIVTVTTGTNPYNNCQIKAAITKEYENNNCNGSSNPGAYKKGQEAPRYRVQSGVVATLGNGYYRIPLTNISVSERANAGSTSQGYQCKTEKIESYRQYSLVAYVNPNDSTNNCPYATDKDCKSCAWPYVAKADTANCGCRVSYDQYQSVADLEAYAYLYCQTAGTDGTQYVYDRSRSNMDASKGEIFAACTSIWTRNTVYVPVGTCPAPRLDTAINDTTAQDISDPIKPALQTGGGGTGSDTATHSRLDSILGLINDGRDADSIAALPDSNAWDSVQTAATGVQADIDSLQVGRARTGGPWSATVPYPDTIEMKMDVPVFGTVMDTTLIVDWVIPGFPFDLWSLFRWIEWVFVTMAMIPLFVRIAGGNEDS